MTKKEREEQEAREHLRQVLKPGDTVHCILRHVSRSGMYRAISLVHFDDEGRAYHLDYWAAILLSGYDERHSGLRAGGCGMDMGFHLVYSLACRLWPDGFDCIGEGCPASDHNNYRGAEVPSHHHDGGYALKHNWL